MKAFPESDYTFKITVSDIDAFERLKTRTETSENLTSQITDKTFRGIIKDNTFKITLSEIDKGAFCVLEGKVENQHGQLNVSINKAFQFLLSIILCLPIVLLIADLVSSNGTSSIKTLFNVILLMIFLRFLFIELAFKILSKRSINRLSDILEIESIEKN